MKLNNALGPTPVIGITGFSGSGKTTLIEQLIPRIQQHGIRVAVIKHAHHRFDVDTPGKDSYRFREAGAQQVLVASGQRWALINEHRPALNDPDLSTLITHLDHANLDLVLVEGFKHIAFPKMELNRAACQHPLRYAEDDSIIALICDHDEHDTVLPVLALDDVAGITAFIVQYQHQCLHEVGR